MSARIATFLYRWRRPLTVLVLLGAVLSVPTVQVVTRIDNDITAWFSREDPVFQQYERFRAEFGGTRTLIVALESQSGPFLTPERFRYLEEITSAVERIELVQRASSLANANIVSGSAAEGTEEDGTLLVRPLAEVFRDRGVDEVRRLAMEDELIRGDLISEDGRVAALIVSFDEDRIDEVRGRVIDAVHRAVRADVPAGVRLHFNGSLEISETYNRITLDNTEKFTPPILLLTVGAIYLMFRSWRRTLLAMVAVLISVLWTLGLYTLMGFSYNVLSSMLVPLVIVLAIADDVHIMQHFEHERRHRDGEGAFKASVTHLLAPLLGASATTALGMLSLATSDVVAVRQFGIGAAVGIMVDFAISIVFMPTVLAWMRPETGTVSPHERHLVEPMRRVAKFSSSRPKLVLLVSGAIGVVTIAGMSRLYVDTNHINFFSTTHPLSTSAAIIDEELSGIYSFNILLEGPPESLRSPESLQRIERVSAALRQLPYVKKVSSVADYLKRINRELHDGRPEAAVVPGDARTIAQELFVFGMSDRGRVELERVVASDYSRAQIAVKLASMSSDLVFAQIEKAEEIVAREFAGSEIVPTVTGSGRLFATLDHYLVRSQLSSFGTAFVTVFGVIFLVFRSARHGVLAIVPNLFPVLAVLGIMGWLEISMNVATIMVSSVALGVVDDDTIHFINRFRRDRARGATVDRAIEAATVFEGRAALTTAIINSAGYGVLLLSEYKPTAWFGGLLALTMATAFLAEVFVLPATIKLVPWFQGPGREGLETRRQGGRAGRRPGLETRHVLRRATVVLFVAGMVLVPGLAAAQVSPSGYVSVMVDALPNADPVAATELRGRIFVEEQVRPAGWLTLYGSAELDGALREIRGSQQLFSGTEIRGSHQFQGYAEFANSQGDLRVGFTRVAWGRLDEVQPTDVVNPLDLARYFFEGRAEARLPVAMARGRLFFGERATLEGIVVPVFRRGVFDRLDEPSSPFDLEAGQVVCLGIGICPPLYAERVEPAKSWRNVQGGGRASITTGRLDWSVSAYRGFTPFGEYTVLPPDPLALTNRVDALRSFPRFTMVGGDFETTRGKWALRGELAAQLENRTGFDAGVGFDRRAGDYHLSGTVLVHRENDRDVRPRAARHDPYTSTSLVASGERTFARARYRTRTFAVFNATDRATFLRNITAMEVRANVILEGSIGWFFGDGRSTISQFTDRDFLYGRLRVHF